MEEIKKMLASVSTDKRVLLLLIGWGFGNFGRGDREPEKTERPGVGALFWDHIFQVVGAVHLVNSSVPLALLIRLS